MNIEQTSFATGDAVASIDQSINLGSYSNTLLLVLVSMNNDNNETVSAVTWNGSESLDKLDHEFTEDDARVEIWSLTNPTAGNHTLECDFSTTLLRQAIVGYLVISSVDQTTPLGTMASTASQSGAGTSVSINVSSTAGDLVVAVICAESADSLTDGAGQTEHWNTSLAARTYGAASSKTATGTTTTMAYTLGADEHHAMAGVAVKPAASGHAGPLVNGRFLKSKQKGLIS